MYPENRSTDTRTTLRPFNRYRALVIVVVLSLVTSASLAGVALGDGPTAEGGAGPVNEALLEHPRQPDVQTPPTGFFNLSDSDGTIDGRDGTDRFGWSIATGDVNGDGHADVLIGAPGNNSTGANGGAAYLFYGPVDAEDVSSQDADVRFHGEAEGDLAGLAVDLGDVDSDGTDDVIVGAPLADTAEEDAGAVYVVSGSSDLSGTVGLGEADAKLTGTSAGDRAGISVAARDGESAETATLAVGAPGSSETSIPGGVYLLAPSDLGDNTSLTQATAILTGESNGDQAGMSVAWAGDVNADNRSELLVGAPRRNTSAGPRAGTVYVVNASTSGERSLSSAEATLVGPREGEHAGFAVAGAGDVNGDNASDLLVGAPYSDRRDVNAGAAYVVYGSERLSGERNLSSANITIGGESVGDRAGWTVSGGGDVDCDGRNDMVVGAPFGDTPQRDAGSAYLLYGRSTDGNLSASKLVGEQRSDLAGLALATDANVTGDQADDVLIGAPNDANSQVNGTVYRVDGGCGSPSAERGDRSDSARTGASSGPSPRTSGNDQAETADGDTFRDVSSDAFGEVMGGERFTENDDSEERFSSRDGNADVDEPNDGNDADRGDESDESGESSDGRADGGAKPGDGGEPDEGNPDDGDPDDGDPAEDEPDDSEPDTPRERTDSQRQGLHVYQNQCQHQSDSSQQQAQSQSLSATQVQSRSSTSVLFQYQHVYVNQRQCQDQSGSNARQTQRQSLLIRFVAQEERRDETGDEQHQGASIASNQSQRQTQSDADQSQTQVQEFEVTFLYQRQSVPDSNTVDQWQSQHLHVQQRQSQVQGDGVNVSQYQYQRVSVVYQGQEQVTEGDGSQRQNQDQSMTSAQQQRQNQSATNLTQAQNESVTFDQNQSYHQNSTNATQGQNQTLSVSQRQDQSQGDGAQVQSEEQNVTASQNGTQDGGSNQTQVQNQSGSLAQDQTQSTNLTTGNQTSSQNSSATIDQNQTQFQNGTGNDQSQNQSVTGQQNQSQMQNETEDDPDGAESTASSSSSEAADTSPTTEAVTAADAGASTSTTTDATTSTATPTTATDTPAEDVAAAAADANTAATETTDDVTTDDATGSEGEQESAGTDDESTTPTTADASSSNEVAETETAASEDETTTAETESTPSTAAEAETTPGDESGEERNEDDADTTTEPDEQTTTTEEGSASTEADAPETDGDSGGTSESEETETEGEDETDDSGSENGSAADLTGIPFGTTVGPTSDFDSRIPNAATESEGDLRARPVAP